MKHSLAVALSLMLVSGTALADDRLIGADVEKALEQSRDVYKRQPATRPL